jgi:hypothetical protein
MISKHAKATFKTEEHLSSSTPKLGAVSPSSYDGLSKASEDTFLSNLAAPATVADNYFLITSYRCPMRGLRVQSEEAANLPVIEYALHFPAKSLAELSLLCCVITKLDHLINTVNNLLGPCRAQVSLSAIARSNGSKTLTTYHNTPTPRTTTTRINKL